MCGIVGLLALDARSQERLGEMFVSMLIAMSPRGPDSTGVAWYDQPGAGAQLRVSLLGPDDPAEWDAIGEVLELAAGCRVTLRAYPGSAVLEVPGSDDDAGVVERIAGAHPGIQLIGTGYDVDVLKSCQPAAEHVARFGLATRSGRMAVGHTRMATESAVVAEGCHPFAPGDGLTLVHNGSFSNYTSVRGDLARRGVRFESDNDSEVCARLVASHRADGVGLGAALERVAEVMDGFYTLLAADASTMALAIDPIGCKPAVVAEHPAYVAIASEYHALAGLPDIAAARLFEPSAGTVHTWEAA